MILRRFLCVIFLQKRDRGTHQKDNLISIFLKHALWLDLLGSAFSTESVDWRYASFFMSLLEGLNDAWQRVTCLRRLTSSLGSNQANDRTMRNRQCIV